MPLLHRWWFGPLTFPVAAGSQATTLTNGDFESGVLSPWFQGVDFSPTGEDWNVTMADAHEGGFSATNTGNKELRQDFDGISTDSILEISFWVRARRNGRRSR